MIVGSNIHVPALKSRLKIKGDEKPIAKTEAGDEAYYITFAPKRKRRRRVVEESDDDDDDDVDEDLDELSGSDLEHAVKSLTRANWMPNFTDRMTVFIGGAPGAGKSYLAKQLINLLPETLPILLFTALEEKDGNFDELGEKRLYKIKMVPEILSKITLKEIRERVKSDQAILLFDDIDKIRDPKIQNLTFSILNDALANGRGHEKHDGKGDIHVICTSHSLNDYQKTKYAFENSNYVALFPGSTPALQLQLFFNKLGLDKDLCREMMKLGRSQRIRSVIVHKVVPMYMIFGDKIMLV